MEVSDKPTDGKGLRVLGLAPEFEVVISASGERGPAAVAGISRGDYIAAVDGVPVTSKKELEDQVNGLTAGDRVPIKVIDGQTGSPRTVEAVVGAVGVDGATVQALREASGAASKDEHVWKRPEEWERVPECFLHPSEAKRIAELESANAELEGALADCQALLAKQLAHNRALADACRQALADPTLQGLEGAGSGELKREVQQPVRVLNDDGQQLGKGTARVADGQPELEVAFADGSKRSSPASGDGQKLQWQDGEVWTRKPNGLTGVWYDENNERKTIDPADSAGVARARDEEGSEIGQGTFSGEGDSGRRAAEVGRRQGVAARTAAGSACGSMVRWGEPDASGRCTRQAWADEGAR
jgi:hypothetical protein